MGQIRVRYMYDASGADDGIGFRESLLDCDSVRDVEFLTPGRTGRDMRFGGVMIRLEPPGKQIILGVAGTWLEWDGVRYETMDDYRQLRKKVESGKIAELLEKM